MNKLENLINKRGFVYQVDNEYYYIGQWIFKQCINGAVINFLDQYRELLNSDEENEERLYYLYRKIMAYSEFEMVESDKYIETNKKTLEFVEELSTENKEIVLKQLDDFVSTFKQLYKKYYL